MKVRRLAEVYEKMRHTAAEFVQAPDGMVFGEGDIKARIMLIGEAPGAEEIRLKRPFVGRAGKNLDMFLAVIGQKRETIYISNVVKYRPVRRSKKGTVANRSPNRKEIRAFSTLLMEEIRIIQPEIVVTLGNVPLFAVTGDMTLKIGTVHAKTMPIDAEGHACTLFPLYHPASIIYNRALKAVYAEDLRVLAAYIKRRKSLRKTLK